MYSTEKEIIDGCLNRKRKAQKALFEKYHAPLMGICMRYSKSKTEAEDVLMMGTQQAGSTFIDRTGRK